MPKVYTLKICRKCFKNAEYMSMGNPNMMMGGNQMMLQRSDVPNKTSLHKI
jgi:hypothetical protein